MAFRRTVDRAIVKEVQSYTVDWKSILPGKLYESIYGYSMLKMVPIDMVFLPLLTLSSSLMGHSTLKVDDLGFEEPAIIWTLAVQPKGEIRCI